MAFANNTAYQATTDGMVCAFSRTTGRATLIGYTDSNSSPSTEIFNLRDAGPQDQTSTCNITMPVKKNDYWKVNGNGTVTIRWMPLGA